MSVSSSVAASDDPRAGDDDVKTVDETAKIVRYSTRTLLSKPMRELLTPFKMTPRSRRLFYRKSDIEKFLADRAAESAA